MLLLDLHTDFSRGRSGDLVFLSLSEFPTVCCDPQIKGFGIVSKAEIDLFWNSRLGQVSIGPFVKPVQKSGGCL